MCLLLTVLLIGPRIGLIALALMFQSLWRSAELATSGGVLVLCAGWLFMPWTTMAWVLMHQNGLVGYEIAVFLIGVVFDILSWGNSKD